MCSGSDKSLLANVYKNQLAGLEEQKMYEAHRQGQMQRIVEEMETKLFAEMTGYQNNILMGSPLTQQAATTYNQSNEQMRRASNRLGSIKTDRLSLRMHYENPDLPMDPFIQKVMDPFIQKVVNWLNDKELMKYSEQRHIEHTKQTQLSYLNDNFSGTANQSRYWYVILNDNERGIKNDLIGSITGHVFKRGHSLRPRSKTPSFAAWKDRLSVNIGIMLGEQHGHGYASEALSAVVNYYSDTGIKHMEVGMMPDNEAMVKLAKTCGFKFDRLDESNIYYSIRIE